MPRKYNLHVLSAVGNSNERHSDAESGKKCMGRRELVLQSVDLPQLTAKMICSSSSQDCSGINPKWGYFYTHNPYATVKATMLCGSIDKPQLLNASKNTNSDGLQKNHNKHSTRDAVSVEDSAVGDSLLGNFIDILGDIPKKACTPAGCRILVAIIRFYPDKIPVIFDKLIPYINVIVLDYHGCHVVRTLIEHGSVNFIEALVPRLAPETIFELAASSQRSRRVLQALFARHKGAALTSVVAVIAQKSQELAVLQQGCISLIYVIENTLPEQRRLVMGMLLPVLPILAVSSFGNYVVQCIVRNMDQKSMLSVVCLMFAGHWVLLSCNKFASNVVEKVVWQIDWATRRAVVEELIFDANNLRRLMRDGFGNFVLQTVIDSSSDVAEFEMISSRMRPQLRASPHGQKLENKLQSALLRLVRGTPAPTVL